GQIATQVVVRDITERKMAETALYEANQLMETIFENMHIMVACLDPKFNFIRVNRAYAQADKRKPSSFTGKNHFDLYPNAENEAIFRQVVETGEPHFAVAKSFRYPENPERGISYLDWSLLPIKDVAGPVTGLILILLDVTGNKKAEEALRESEERYRRLVDSSPFGIAITTDGKIVYINHAGVIIHGAASPSEIIGKSLFELLPADYKKHVKERIDKVEEGKVAQVMEEKLLRLDGTVVDVELGAIPFIYYDKKATYSVFQDITERKKAEEEIKKSKKLLEDLHKHLTEIREDERALISREIHDQIGQSLTALKLDLNGMKKYLNTNPEAVAKLESIIGLVSNTIKDVQRISSDLRPGILDDLGLAAAIEWYSGEFEQRTGIRCSLKLDDSTYDDSQKSLVFFRVLQEALTNVIRHANASSVSISLRQSKQGITMTIHDNGIGIPTGKAESGKSLGLIGMRERVRQFGGELVISAKESSGTKLIVFIPK
ncbi:MAG: PAS domain S-box protein, partial [Nanoarchaeota archaeon]